MAVQIYNDNSEGVTGATLNAGETGGTWTKAGELLGVTGGPDGGPAMFVAEMPTAGTVSGGSVNPNSTGPVNSVSPTFGFFLRAFVQTSLSQTISPRATGLGANLGASNPSE